MTRVSTNRLVLAIFTILLLDVSTATQQQRFLKMNREILNPFYKQLKILNLKPSDGKIVCAAFCSTPYTQNCLGFSVKGKKCVAISNSVSSGSNKQLFTSDVYVSLKELESVWRKFTQKSLSAPKEEWTRFIYRTSSASGSYEGCLMACAHDETPCFFAIFHDSICYFGDFFYDLHLAGMNATFPTPINAFVRHEHVIAVFGDNGKAEVIGSKSGTKCYARLFDHAFFEGLRDFSIGFEPESEQLFTCGGFKDGTFQSVCFSLDLSRKSNRKWSQLPGSLTYPRSSHVMAFSQKSMLIIGGISNNSGSDGNLPVEVYDIGENFWSVENVSSNYSLQFCCGLQKNAREVLLICGKEDDASGEGRNATNNAFSIELVTFTILVLPTSVKNPFCGVIKDSEGGNNDSILAGGGTLFGSTEMDTSLFKLQAGSWINMESISIGSKRATLSNVDPYNALLITDSKQILLWKDNESRFVASKTKLDYDNEHYVASVSVPNYLIRSCGIYQNPPGWSLILNQTVTAAYKAPFSPGNYSLNSATSGAHISRLPRSYCNGKLRLKLVFRDLAMQNEWHQSSSITSTSPVQDYQGLMVQYLKEDFHGLHGDSGDNKALFKADPDLYIGNFNFSQVAQEDPARNVELYERKNDDC